MKPGSNRSVDGIRRSPDVSSPRSKSPGALQPASASATDAASAAIHVRAVVFVAGRAELRPVKIGQRNGLEAQVLEGLEPGDRVVVHPSDRVQDGVQIAVR